MTLRALIFDVDGTLAETEEQAHRIAFNRAFAEAGLDWHWDSETYGDLLPVAGGKERIAFWCRVNPSATKELKRPNFEAWAARLHAAKTGHYASLLRTDGIALRPGVARLVQQALESGLRLAIATTTQERNVHELLAATWGPQAALWFDVIGAGDAVPRKKPAPDIYTWVLRELGLQPNEALALEDSAIGARAALGAGLPVLVTRSRYTAGDDIPPGVLADLDHLGHDEQPAQGRALRQAWRGQVTLAQLASWHREAHTLA